MNVLDLFSGIGGFSLGLERAGMRTVAFCEIDPFCRRVLAKHWPGVPCYDDVRTLTANRLRADGITADVICGGFPCQDISIAGKGAGIEGERSGLWTEYARIIGELRPRHVIVENVAALLNRGLDRVLGDMAALGYDAEWHCIPASAIGAPHRRDRIWIVAYTGGDKHQGGRASIRGALAEELSRAVADAEGNGRLSRRAGHSAQVQERRQSDRGAISPHMADAISKRKLQSEGRQPDQWRRPSDGRWWFAEPDVGRVAHGVPARVDRLRGLGNAVVPQIPEIIGRAIMKAHPASRDVHAASFNGEDRGTL